jgi:hypothetical protein
MYPGQGDQFGAPIDPTEGPFFGGGSGGPPSGDAMFESFLEGDDEIDALPKKRTEERNDEVLNVGLHFFEKMRGLR